MDRTDMVLESEHETIIELVDLIGAENTRKLVDTFSGSHIYIPSVETVERKYRDMNIYEDFLSGMSYSELRHKYKLSEKTIRAIVNVEREKERRSENERKRKHGAGAEPIQKRTQ